MVESAINSRFIEYMEDVEIRSRSILRKTVQFFENLIYKDEEEYLDRPDIPFHVRYSVVERLSRLNDVSGYNRVFLLELSKLVRQLNLGRRKPIRILDIGAGGGGLLKAIYRWADRHHLKVELAGIDASAEFVVATQYQFNRAGIPAVMYRADASSITDVPDQSYDIVLSSYMVHHIRTPGRVALFLKEVHRIAKHGWIIADFDRRLYAPAFVGVTGFLLSGHPVLVSDGIKSAQRAYHTSEINFILSEMSRMNLQTGMQCRPYPLLPYWMIVGTKPHVAIGNQTSH